MRCARTPSGCCATSSAIYSQLVSRLDEVDSEFAATQRSHGGSSRVIERDRPATSRDLPPPPDNGEVLGVPEFIPPS